MKLAKIIVISALVLAGAFLAPSACTEPNETERQLTQMGYTDVTITGYDFFACSQGDSYSTGFKATSPTGAKVSGVYCSGFLKAGTVRFY